MESRRPSHGDQRDVTRSQGASGNGQDAREPERDRRQRQRDTDRQAESQTGIQTGQVGGGDPRPPPPLPASRVTLAVCRCGSGSDRVTGVYVAVGGRLRAAVSLRLSGVLGWSRLCVPASVILGQGRAWG